MSRVRLPQRGLALAVLAVACAAPAGAAPPVPDTMAQRVLACTGCHGPQGRASPSGYQPRIAGKPAGYLYNQLQNFRAGRRQYPLMTGLIETLSDDYLREIATHFATLELPYPPPPPTTASADVLARGRALATQGDAARRIPACSACHGAALGGVNPAVPGLLGLPRDYLNGQLGAWRTGNRRAQAPDCMAQVAQALSLDEINAVSHWLAAQPLAAGAKPAAALPAPMPFACGGVASVAGTP